MNNLEILGQVSQRHIAVIGDMMVDRYIWGKTSRISEEAPVPVVQVQSRSETLGGAANVLRNLACLGARTSAFGAVGQDPGGDSFAALCAEDGIDTRGIVITPERPTTRKSRVVCGRQQMLRLDDEVTSAIAVETTAEICARFEALLAEDPPDAVIIEDYCKGCVSQELAGHVVAIANSAGIAVALDPHPGNRLWVQDLVLLKPNCAEAYAMANLPAEAPLEAVVQTLLERWQAKNLLITLGRRGMALAQEDGTLAYIATAPREVFDVSGAGDTSIATFVACLASGASPLQAANIANEAGGVVVTHVGTVPITLCELRNALAVS